ncbi:MAG: hypothetical protein K0R12_601 [Gammaproteobacteria bacterium]|jgi:hypothetical protein|nr:hypothetical protein [Gammaproteobacteria bacterium]
MFGTITNWYQEAREVVSDVATEIHYPSLARGSIQACKDVAASFLLSYSAEVVFFLLMHDTGVALLPDVFSESEREINSTALSANTFHEFDFNNHPQSCIFASEALKAQNITFLSNMPFYLCVNNYSQHYYLLYPSPELWMSLGVKVFAAVVSGGVLGVSIIRAFNSLQQSQPGNRLAPTLKRADREAIAEKEQKQAENRKRYGYSTPLAERVCRQITNMVDKIQPQLSDVPVFILSAALLAPFFLRYIPFFDANEMPILPDNIFTISEEGIELRTYYLNKEKTMEVVVFDSLESLQHYIADWIEQDPANFFIDEDNQQTLENLFDASNSIKQVPLYNAAYQTEYQFCFLQFWINFLCVKLLKTVVDKWSFTSEEEEVDNADKGFRNLDLPPLEELEISNEVLQVSSEPLQESGPVYGY